MSRKIVRDRLSVELRDYAPGSQWVEEFARILSNCDHLDLKIRRPNGSFEPKGENGGLWRADLQVMAVSPASLAKGIAELTVFRQVDPNTPILALTDEQSAKPLLRLMEAGASDLLAPPWCQAKVLARLERLVNRPEEVGLGARAAATLREENGMVSVIGKSGVFVEQLQRAKRYALCNAVVLITGETGTGKEIFARAVHHYGPRRKRPFVAINCAALPNELVENELFGHQAGAFTGAVRGHRGLIAQAESGTLFLDEIESLTNAVQAKLLRFLQEHEYRPLGGAASRQVDVRVIAASNANLAGLSHKGIFRQDLYFRLNVLTLTLPPLRQRREDIPLLVTYLIERHTAALALEPMSFSSGAMDRMISYSWPGNIRELENVILRALITSSGPVVQAESVELPNAILDKGALSFKQQKARAVKEFEHHYLADILVRSKGNVSQAARAASKDRRSFRRLLRKHNLAWGAEEHCFQRPSFQASQQLVDQECS